MPEDRAPHDGEHTGSLSCHPRVPRDLSRLLSRPVRRFSSSARTAALAFALALVLRAVACSRSARQPKPVATLSTSPDAAAAFAALRARWELRKVDPASARDFIRRFPNDGAVPLAKVYLAFALIQEGDLIKADGVLTTLARSRSPARRAISRPSRARGAFASTARRSRRSTSCARSSARSSTTPIARSSSRSSRSPRSPRTTTTRRSPTSMRGCAASARTIASACASKIAQILETLPRGVLEQTYRTMRSRGVRVGLHAPTRRSSSRRASRASPSRRTTPRSRAGSSTSAARAPRRPAVMPGSSSASSRRAVVVSRSSPARPSGLLLPTRTRELRDEAADVVRGVSWALDLPRRAGAADGRASRHARGRRRRRRHARRDGGARRRRRVRDPRGLRSRSADRASVVERAERRAGAAPRSAERRAHAEDHGLRASANAPSASSRCSVRRSYATA